MRTLRLPLPLTALLGALALAACQPVQTREPQAQRLQPSVSAIPAAAPFSPGAPQPIPAMRANADMVQDFLELGFSMESGRPIPQFSRFEGPIRVVTRGMDNRQAQSDLDRLLARLRDEARIDIARAANNGDSGQNILTVEFVPRRQMHAVVPAAACFVVPNIASWEEFIAHRRDPLIDWTRVGLRQRAALFVPADSTPQETRDCLHEEIAQALGPLNDLFRLPDSVFNDDNFQTTLTGFDMLILRAWYSPDLRVGMSRDEVAARLPTVLNRLNPNGRRPGGAQAGPTPRDWVQAVENALSGNNGASARRANATRALEMARAQGWQDSRLALSLLLRARLADRDEGQQAFASLLQAAEIYRRMPGGEVHAAHIDMQLAVQALASGQFDLVMDLTARALPIAHRTENAAFEATLTYLRATALQETGRVAEAEALRREVASVAQYGFGTASAANNRQEEIARIAGAALRLAAN